MVVESLSELKTAFRGWRSKKRYPRESVPEELLGRARRAVAVHGLAAVVKATRFDRSRLSGGRKDGVKERKASLPTVPSYSRLELAGPMSAARALVEAETQSGMKLRIFQITPETLSLLTVMCGAGGAS